MDLFFVRKEVNVMPKPVRYTFKDRATGAPVATAIIPEGYLVNATITDKYSNDLVPLQAYTSALTEDHSIVLNSHSKCLWEHVINSLMKHTAKMTGVSKANFADYQDPPQFLLDFVAPYFDSKKIMPVATATLPGSFADNRQAIHNSFVQEFIDKEGNAPNVQLEIVSSICEPILMKFMGTRKGKPTVVLAGYELMGVEYRNAIRPEMLMGGTIGLMSVLMGAAKKKPKSQAPFGHAKERDSIRWGYNRLYTCICDAELEGRATEEFLRFVLSFTPDMSFIQRREQLAYEKWVQAMQFANQLSAQARQGQIQAQQRALEASRMIAQNSAEMSAGIMDSWNRKMASDSRISQSRSEAIRGVNMYQTTYGRNVEVDVTADHVYQNNYGDVYGVSGSAPDQELLNRLNWTELHRR